ncbi:MAG: hypothetical protein MZV65_13330 [Chromatiales bacterium]|nr:hypothetical protein [Chromatiales bacterium]
MHQLHACASWLAQALDRQLAALREWLPPDVLGMSWSCRRSRAALALRAPAAAGRRRRGAGTRAGIRRSSGWRSRSCWRTT